MFCLLNALITPYSIAYSTISVSSPPGAMSSLAVVCGGSRGIGKAVSRLLAQRGCRVAVVSRNEDTASATVASLQGGKATLSVSVILF